MKSKMKIDLMHLTKGLAKDVQDRIIKAIEKDWDQNSVLKWCI